MILSLICLFENMLIKAGDSKTEEDLKPKEARSQQQEEPGGAALTLWKREEG